jgi:hypothetical protein
VAGQETRLRALRHEAAAAIRGETSDALLEELARERAARIDAEDRLIALFAAQQQG